MNGSCCMRVIIMTDVVYSLFPSHHLFCGGGELTHSYLCYRWLLRSHAKPCNNLSFFYKHLSFPQLLSFLPPLLLIWLLSSLSALSLVSQVHSFCLHWWCVEIVCKAAVVERRWDVSCCTTFYMDGEQWVGCCHPVLLSLKGLVLLTHTGADMCIRRTPTTQLYVSKHLFVEIMQQCLKTDA